MDHYHDYMVVSTSTHQSIWRPIGPWGDHPPLVVETLAGNTSIPDRLWRATGICQAHMHGLIVTLWQQTRSMRPLRPALSRAALSSVSQSLTDPGPCYRLETQRTPSFRSCRSWDLDRFLRRKLWGKLPWLITVCLTSHSQVDWEGYG